MPVDVGDYCTTNPPTDVVVRPPPAEGLVTTTS
jgi:hypothetical protein